MICQLQISSANPGPPRLLLDLALLAVPEGTSPEDEPPLTFSTSFDATQSICRRWIETILLPTLGATSPADLPGKAFLAEVIPSGSNGHTTWTIPRSTIQGAAA